MHLFIVLFLILFAGWTISTHICAVLGLNLNALILMSPFVVAALFGTYYVLLKTKRQFLHNPSSKLSGMRHGTKNTFIYSLVALIFLPVALYLSWLLFWVLSIVILILSLLRGDEGEVLVIDNSATNVKKLDYVIIAILALAAIGLTYTVSSSILDDDIYVAIAAFAAAHPTHAIHATDPMLGLPDILSAMPLLRFHSFQLLSGAIAYLLSTPAMNVYYIYLLPFWSIAWVVSIFLFTKEIVPRYWLLSGVVTLLFTLLLGEGARSPSYLSFAYLYIGRAVFLTVMVPTIFYLTTRLFSERGTKADLFLLACCQIASVGISGTGMIIGPLAAFSALMSNIPLVITGERKKLYYAFATLFIPLPYLISIVLSDTTAMLNFDIESASNVWISTFGPRQQYLVGFLLMAGPVLAKDMVTRWRLTVPPLLLFAIYLNPLFSEFISKYVTSPSVYFRVVWSFPVLIYVAVSFCMIVVGLFAGKSRRLISVVLSVFALCMIIYTFPYHSLRSHFFQGEFATWKIPSAHLVVAQKAMEVSKAMDANYAGGKLLAPREIAGVISRFEEHPPLILTRALYYGYYQQLLGKEKAYKRLLLWNLVIAKCPRTDQTRSAINELDVSVVVFQSENETDCALSILEKEGFTQQASINGYTIWARPRDAAMRTFISDGQLINAGTQVSLPLTPSAETSHVILHLALLAPGAVTINGTPVALEAGLHMIPLANIPVALTIGAPDTSAVIVQGVSYTDAQTETAPRRQTNTVIAQTQSIVRNLVVETEAQVALDQIGPVQIAIDIWDTARGLQYGWFGSVLPSNQTGVLRMTLDLASGTMSSTLNGATLPIGSTFEGLRPGSYTARLQVGAGSTILGTPVPLFQFDIDAENRIVAVRSNQVQTIVATPKQIIALPIAQFADDTALFTPTPKKLNGQPGHMLNLLLTWRALRDGTEERSVLLHLLDAQGNRVAQFDGPPGAGIMPTTAWRAGDIILDARQLALPTDLKPGNYTLIVGMYRWPSLEAVPLTIEGVRHAESVLHIPVVVTEN